MFLTHSLTVSSKVGKQFFNFNTLFFYKNHPYKKIFNRNKIKISYSYTSNFKIKIIAHNKKKIKKKTT